MKRALLAFFDSKWLFPVCLAFGLAIGFFIIPVV